MNINRIYAIMQTEQYAGDDWWEWEVWVESSRENLKLVKDVTYKLHHSFRNPLRTVSNRNSKFKLKSEGWGGFNIQVKISLIDGRAIRLEHNLELHYPSGKRTLK